MARRDSIDRLDAADGEAWIASMRAGDFRRAWILSERIRSRNAGRRDWSRPRHLQQIWDGTPLEGRRVLVRCYHGLGDTIQFIRYVPLLRRTAATVVVWAQAALLPILGTVAGIDRLLPLHDGSPDADYDVDIEIMELPHAFRTSLETIPATISYLTAAPAPLPGRERAPRVALFWRGGEWDPRRSIAFELLDHLLRVDRVSWYAFPQAPSPLECHDNLLTLAAPTILRTAELVRACDLVISVDSMPAHLAGALGLPTWTLLPCEADWRWLEQRDDSPWYPTMRLFRQPCPGNWSAVIQAVKSAIECLIQNR